MKSVVVMKSRPILKFVTFHQLTLPQEAARVEEKDPLSHAMVVEGGLETLPVLGASWTIVLGRRILVHLIFCGNHFRQ